MKLSNKQRLILAEWQKLGVPRVGARELELIQHALIERLGEGGQESPASIARTLAESGAQLKHSEVLSCDARWRERRLYELFGPEDLSFVTLAAAQESMNKLVELERLFAAESDAQGAKLIRDFAVGLKRELLFVSRTNGRDEATRQIAKEVVQWLTVWLQNPLIFGDWLALRQRSPAFIERFGEPAS